MTTTEFRTKYQQYQKIQLKVKPGIERVQIGGYILDIHNFSKNKIMAYVEDNTIFVLGKGSKSRGYRAFNDQQILDQFDIVEDDKNAKWHKRLNRAIKAMEGSGLWPNILEKFKYLKTMTYEDKKAIYDLFWVEDDGYRNSNDVPVEERNQAFEKHYGEYIKKYPFIFRKNDNGQMFVDTDYIWELSECKLKSMYFGKYINEEYKNDIKKAISDKTKIGRMSRTSYDVSFSYDPDKNRAWYSEEYKNCGNGHYFLALDHSLALFCEND